MFDTIGCPAPLRAALIAQALTTIGLIALPSAAYAGHKIYSPDVEQGETELEFRGHNNQDNDNAVDGTGEYLFGVGHGFTPFWFSELYAVFEYEHGDHDIEAVEWENIFQLTQTGKYWADFGLLTELEFSVQGSAHEFKIGPLIEKSFGRWVATVNLFLAHEFGQSSGDETELEYSARLLYELNEYFEPAIEIYGSPGPIGDFESGDEQKHQIGPAFYGEIPLGNDDGEIEYSGAALAGITDKGSPDWTFVLRTEYAF